MTGQAAEPPRREVAAARGLVAFAKVSGAKGLHLHVPLDGSDGFDATKAFAGELARGLAAADPRRER